MRDSLSINRLTDLYNFTYLSTSIRHPLELRQCMCNTNLLAKKRNKWYTIHIDMFLQKIKHIITSLHIAVVALLVTLSVLGTLNISTFARCTVSSTPVTIANIISITDPSHYPIIPNGCTGAISPESLPAILIRSYGFVSSLALNLFFFFIVWNGLLWIYSGIDNGQSAGKAKKNIQSAAIGLGLVFFAYVFVNTFVTVFVAGGEIPSIQEFFNSNIN